MDVEGLMQAVHGRIILPSYVRVTNPVGEKQTNKNHTNRKDLSNM